MSSKPRRSTGSAGVAVAPTPVATVAAAVTGGPPRYRPPPEPQLDLRLYPVATRSQPPPAEERPRQQPAIFAATPESVDQALLAELRTLKEANRRLGEDNRELRDLCCFLDDDRQKGRKLAREWQRFGRYTASVMRQEVSAYQSKLRELDNKQQELIKDNLELKELCLYLDEERGGPCPSCGAGGGNGALRDDGDGSSSSTAPDELQLPAPPPAESAREGSARQRSAFVDRTAQYVRNLEAKVKQLEEEKRVLQNRLSQISSDPTFECLPSSTSRPEAIVRALQVLEVRDRERDMGISVDGALDDDGTADIDESERALVKEICNVMWRKTDEGPSAGRR